MDNIINKNIKRLRESTFTAKRNPYKKYQKAKWNLFGIFLKIDLLKNTQAKFLKIISGVICTPLVKV